MSMKEFMGMIDSHAGADLRNYIETDIHDPILQAAQSKLFGQDSEFEGNIDIQKFVEDIAKETMIKRCMNHEQESSSESDKEETKAEPEFDEDFDMLERDAQQLQSDKNNKRVKPKLKTKPKAKARPKRKKVDKMESIEEVN